MLRGNAGFISSVEHDYVYYTVYYIQRKVFSNEIKCPFTSTLQLVRNR